MPDKIIFTDEERELLDRHLAAYIKLANGQIKANTEARRHFLDVLAGRAVASTPHETAFVKHRILAVRMEREERKQAEATSSDNLDEGHRIYPRSVGDKFDIKFKRGRN